MTVADRHLRATNVEQTETIDETLTQLNTSTQAGVTELANGTTPVIGDDSNFLGNGFVKRDPGVFIGKDVNHVGNQIKHLRGRLMWLISAEAKLSELTELREPLTINSYIDAQLINKNSLAFSSYNKNSLVVPENNKSNSVEEYLSELSSIEAQLYPNLELPKLSKVLQCLSEITNEIELRIAKVNSSFDSAVFPALSRDEFVEAMMFKIKHQKLREEANIQLTLIRKFGKMLDGNLLTRADFDVLSDKGEAAVSVMIAIEKRRKIVEELVRSDQKERKKTIRLVRRYVIGAVVITVLLSISAIIATFFINLFGWKEVLQNTGLQIPVNLSTTNLDKLKTPILGIPGPVIIWSLIGSFAAMLHRYNHRPIEDFDEAEKWLLTRPVQGVVLGSTFYLVLNSGFFLIPGINNSDSSIKDEVTLILSFLVGFSDRFVDSVFNALVDRYSRENVNQEENQTNQSKNTGSYRSNVSLTQYKRRQIKSDKQHDPE